MRLKSKIHLWVCCLILLSAPLVRAQAAGACEYELPSQARKAVASKMKRWKVLTAADLAADDREIWENEYEEKCPGVAAGQFGPSQSRAYAVMLIRSRNGALYEALVLAAERNGRYEVTMLFGSHKVARASVVRKLPRGSYSSAKGETEIETAYEVIASEAIEAGVTIYYWSGNKYRSLVISE
jgi:hypothetical protein